MANITNYLNKIKTAVYGKDVRGAIHEAIKQVYDDASVNHDNANMEVKMARGTHNTLNDRLDKSEQKLDETNAQLSQINNEKLDKSGIVTMANMGQDVKEAMTGGSVAVVGVDSITQHNVVDGQITSRLTDFMNSSTNLFDCNRVFSGNVGHEDGNFYNDEGYYRSDYIKIKSGKTYKFEQLEPVYFFRIAWYKKNYEFISGEQITNTESKNLIAPSEASFCVISFQVNPNESMFFGLKDDKYMPFDYSYLEEKYYNPGDNLITYTIDNLFNPDVFRNKILEFDDSSRGKLYSVNLKDHDSYYVSKPIPVERNTYTFWYGSDLVNFNVKRVFLLNNNLKVIDMISNAHLIEVTDDIKYIVISSEIWEIENTMMCLGEDKPKEFKKHEKYLEDSSGKLLSYSNAFGWNGKKVATLGDSITQYGFWQIYVKDYFMIDSIYNLGISGSTVSNATTQKWWVNGVTGEAYGSVDDFAEKPNDNAVLIDGYFCSETRVNTIPLDSDLVLIMGGTNDMSKSVEIGELRFNGKRDITTFKGALAETINKIQNRLPNSQIVLMTPIYNTGLDIVPYCNAIKEVGYELAIPVIDTHLCGINQFNAIDKLRDGVHPTYGDEPYTGAKLIAKKVIDGLKVISPKF